MVLALVISRRNDDIVVFIAEGFVQTQIRTVPIDAVGRSRQTLHMLVSFGIVTSHIPRFKKSVLRIINNRRRHPPVPFPRRLLF